MSDRDKSFIIPVHDISGPEQERSKGQISMKSDFIVIQSTFHIH